MNGGVSFEKMCEKLWLLVISYGLDDFQFKTASVFMRIL